MAYIGNPPVVQSSRLVYEETAATAKTAFTPPGGYTVGQLEVYINGSQLMSDDFTATDGSTVNLTTACAVGDGFKSIAYGNFLTTNALNKTGDTMTGPLTLGGLLNTGATGQIKFPAAQNASADANTLDDYEEGTFTLGIRGSSTGGTYTLLNAAASYVKVGRHVTVNFATYLSAASGGVGYTQFTGLPFPNSQSSVGSLRADNVTLNASTRFVDLEFISATGQTILNIHENYSGSSGTDTPIGNVSVAAYFIGSISYLTAT